MTEIYKLDRREIRFPHPTLANSDGILAVGGDLSPDRLLLAYRNGIFPWYEEGIDIIWWSPDPRMVLYPNKLKVSKSMRKLIRLNTYTVTYDKAFIEVLDNCKSINRNGQDGTWITSEMRDAYVEMFARGIAHSVEVWDGKELVGGLYGLSIGKIFCGESMFSKKSNTSKLAFISLVSKLEEKDYYMVDCQVYNDHLSSLGAIEVSRDVFLSELNEYRDKDSWNFVNV